MLKKILIGVFSTLIVGAVGASAYNTVIAPRVSNNPQIVTDQPVEALAAVEQGWQEQSANTVAPGNGPAWQTDDTPAGQPPAFGNASQPAASSDQIGRQRGRGQGGNGWRGGAAQDESSAIPAGEPDPQNGLTEWVSFQGTVSDYAPPSFNLLTADGQTIPVEIGNITYLSNLGLELQNGAQVLVQGFWDASGSVAVGQLTLVDSGLTFTLRDELGRPLWSGGPKH